MPSVIYRWAERPLILALPTFPFNRDFLDIIRFITDVFFSNGLTLAKRNERFLHTRLLRVGKKCGERYETKFCSQKDRKRK